MSCIYLTGGNTDSASQATKIRQYIFYKHVIGWVSWNRLVLTFIKKVTATVCMYVCMYSIFSCLYMWQVDRRIKVSLPVFDKLESVLLLNQGLHIVNKFLVVFLLLNFEIYQHFSTVVLYLGKVISKYVCPCTLLPAYHSTSLPLPAYHAFSKIFLFGDGYSSGNFNCSKILNIPIK